MAYRTRIKYTPEQKNEIWDRWQRGESQSSIGRLFDRESSSVFSLLSPSGGIRPTPRKRSKLALSLSEREEISRGIVNQLSLRTIATQLKRSGGAGKWVPVKYEMVLETDPTRRYRCLCPCHWVCLSWGRWP